MARSQSEAKSGFYPIPEKVVPLILSHLRLPPTGGRFDILDPCAGEGFALAGLADGLGIPHEQCWAIELNPRRAERIAKSYPKVNLLGPCAFEHAALSFHSVSTIYLNPPYSDEYGGGGREEVSFLWRAVDLLAEKGVLVLVCPANQVFSRSRMCELLDQWFEHIEVYLLPDAHRKFGECVVFGTRRKERLDPEVIYREGVLHSRGIHSRWGIPEDQLARLGEHQFATWDYGQPNILSVRTELDVWTIPPSKGPRFFRKEKMTKEELEAALSGSPLYGLLEAHEEARFPRPPLALGVGHTSMVLLSGLLDGYVDSDPPHVVRGHCPKQKTIQRDETYDTPAGAHVHKKVWAEVPDPKVRAVWPDGVIRTFTSLASTSTDEIVVEDVETFEEEEV